MVKGTTCPRNRRDKREVNDALKHATPWCRELGDKIKETEVVRALEIYISLPAEIRRHVLPSLRYIVVIIFQSVSKKPKDSGMMDIHPITSPWDKPGLLAASNQPL